jgi:hypothetical protein
MERRKEGRRSVSDGLSGKPSVLEPLEKLYFYVA